MKTASAELKSLLAGSKLFYMADLFSITLKSGEVIRLTTADKDINYGGATFLSTGPYLERGHTRVVRGIEVDTLELTVYPELTHQIDGLSWPLAIRRGALDNGLVKLERAFLPDWNSSPVGTVILFTGRVADIELTPSAARINVKSDLELLNLQLPRKLYQPGCLHTLYDQGCGLNKASWKETSCVQEGSDRYVIKTTLTQEDGYFDLGIIEFDSGVTRTVKQYQGGNLYLSFPLYTAPTVGESISVFPGCDKKLDTCENKFNNKTKFLGFPFIPMPETIY